MNYQTVNTTKETTLGGTLITRTEILYDCGCRALITHRDRPSSAESSRRILESCAKHQS